MRCFQTPKSVRDTISSVMQALTPTMAAAQVQAVSAALATWAISSTRSSADSDLVPAEDARLTPTPPDAAQIYVQT